MNTKTELLEKTDNRHSKFTTACLASCLKVMEQIARVKQVVVNEFRDTVEAHQKLLRLAMNEAEALAYETDYPHLVFPALAAVLFRGKSFGNARTLILNRTCSNTPPPFFTPVASPCVSTGTMIETFSFSATS